MPCVKSDQKNQWVPMALIYDYQVTNEMRSFLIPVQVQF
jgi:hypothetical protein